MPMQLNRENYTELNNLAIERRLVISDQPQPSGLSALKALRAFFARGWSGYPLKTLSTISGLDSGDKVKIALLFNCRLLVTPFPNCSLAVAPWGRQMRSPQWSDRGPRMTTCWLVGWSAKLWVMDAILNLSPLGAIYIPYREVSVAPKGLQVEFT